MFTSQFFCFNNGFESWKVFNSFLLFVSYFKRSFLRRRRLVGSQHVNQPIVEFVCRCIAAQCTARHKYILSCWGHEKEIERRMRCTCFVHPTAFGACAKHVPHNKYHSCASVFPLIKFGFKRKNRPITPKDTATLWFDNNFVDERRIYF